MSTKFEWEWAPGELRCPACAGVLVARRESLDCAGCGAGYPVRDGIPDLVYPPVLAEQDKRWQEEYDGLAESYDQITQQLALWLEADLAADRERLPAGLDLRPGQTVLEVSVGTGANLPAIARDLGGRGRIVALDLSPGMVRVARRKATALAGPGPAQQAAGGGAPAAAKAGTLRLDFVLANGSHLPFASSTFDAVLHVGGINEFSEKRRAFAEMVRVAKSGARLVVSDEGVPRWHHDSPRGRRLIAGNSLYRHEPPFADVPWEAIEDFHLDWIGNEVFYVFAFRKKT